ncbi:putative bifunctional diguanylate cyclase/phosphodiesterase (plasmid) [Nitrobacteraceae bacterium UC4446_H13]
MKCPDRFADEAERLRSLAEYDLCANASAPDLDPIVEMAAKLFNCLSAAVNVIGDDRVFLASSTGIGECDMSRDASFCAHAINQNGVMVVEDATLDPRFYDNPIVEAGLIRFYAGVPLKSSSGYALGALCVLDANPRPLFSAGDQMQLKELAKLVSDRLELRRLDRAASDYSRRFEASAETSPNAVICFDEQRRITAWNPAAALMFDRSAHEMVGESIDVLIAAKDLSEVHAAIDKVRDGASPTNVNTPLTGVRRNGTQFPAELHWSCWRDGKAIEFGAIVRDVTEQSRERDILYRLANYDTLTGLPNRNMLYQRVDKELRSGKSASLLLLDLDCFTDINNELGYEAGDSALRNVAQRIQHAFPDQSLAARVGDDEFAVLLENGDPIAIDRISREIMATIAQPMLIDGRELSIASNCGIAIAPIHGATVEAITSAAELALLQACQEGTGTTYLFTQALRAKAMARRVHDAELRRAFDRNEFVLFYQPQVQLADGAIVGAEALIRWQHPARGLLAPAAFLPALEKGALASAVGEWVLNTACKQAAIWRQDAPDFRVSVNLFAAQFRSGDLPRLVAEACAASSVPPQGLELEITENIILAEQDRALGQLEEIRDTGVVLSFDDFGTGFASLNLLRSFPVSLIKIDKSFVQLMHTSEKDRVIIVSLIEMARRLGLKVVAEGIEKEADRIFLRRHGCDKGQGYLFGKPMPAQIFAERFLPTALAS